MKPQDKALHLEGALQTLKKQYQSEAIYNEDDINELQRIARSRHQRTEEFFVPGVRLLASLLQDKLGTGWTYEDDEASAIAFPNSPNIVVRLVKPTDILDSEYAALEIRVKDKYLAGIDAAKSKLLSEIASTQLQIKELQKAITQEAKNQSLFDKELRAVELELLSGTEVTNNNNTENNSNDI